MKEIYRFLGIIGVWIGSIIYWFLVPLIWAYITTVPEIVIPEGSFAIIDDYTNSPILFIAIFIPPIILGLYFQFKLAFRKREDS